MEKIAIIAMVFCSMVLSLPVQGGMVVIEPSNVAVPQQSGGLFSFDFVINNPGDFPIKAFQATINISGPGVLTFDRQGSEVVAEVAGYWIRGNSDGAAAIDKGNKKYSFGDNPKDGVAQTLSVAAAVARYSFVWKGTEGDYTFSIDPAVVNTFILDEGLVGHSLRFSPGQYQGDEGSFTIYLPEPSTLAIIGVGSVVLLKRGRW